MSTDHTDCAIIGCRLNRSGIATLAETVPLVEKSGNQSSVDMSGSSVFHSNPSSFSSPMFLELIHLLQG